MKTSISLLILLIVCNFNNKPQDNIDENKVIYICDYASKIFGQTPIVFIETKDTIAMITTYKIYYTREKILRVKKYLDIHKYSYVRKENGNIYIKSLKLEGYSGATFKKQKLNSDEFYKLLNTDFINISNMKKQNSIDSLAHLKK